MGGEFAFLVPAMMCVVGGTFLILWRCGLRDSLPWALGFLGCAAGFTAPVWPSALPEWAIGLVANAFFALGFFCYGRGLIGRADRGRVLEVRQALLGAAIVLPSIAHALDSRPLELLANDLGCAALLGVPLACMRVRTLDPVRRVLFVVAGLVVLETVLRTFSIFVAQTAAGTGDFLATPYAFLMQAGAGTLGLLFAFAALGSVLYDATASYRRDAITDPLSGLLNRRGFAEATAGASAGAVIACDIDHFKRINDLYGHKAGDAVIAGFAAIIRQALPGDAVTMRTGGEEFLAYLPARDAAEATRLANAVRLRLAQAQWDGLDERMTASFGVAIVEGGAPLEAAIARADEALYEAKRAGRDRVYYRLQVVASNERPAQSGAVRTLAG